MNRFRNRKKARYSFVMQSLTCLKQAVEIIANMGSMLIKQRQELQSDRICGHWLGLDINCSITVIKDDDGYLISFFHEGHIGEELRAVISENGIQLTSTTEDPQNMEVYLFDSNNRLVIGGYGTFIRDHVLGYTSSNDMRMKRSKKYKQ